MPSKRAKLSHPSAAERALSDEEADDEEVVDEIEEDEKDADDGGEEVIEEIEEEEGEEEDEQQEVGDQEDYATDENQETEAEDADNEEEDVEEEEEEIEKEVIEEEDEEEEEEEEVEIEVELEEEEEEEEEVEEGAGARARETERGDLGEEEGDAEYEEGGEAEDVERVDDRDADRRDEGVAGLEEDIEEEVDGAVGDAEEDDEADEDVLDADEDVHDTDTDSHDAVEDVNDADEENDGEGREQLAMEEDDDGDGEEDDDDYDEDEHTEELGTEDGDADDERRRQLAILMCFSSLQSLMAMEICRDTTLPFDDIGMEESSSLPGAFFKLMLLAVTSLMQEEGQQCRKLLRPGQEWRHMDRGVSSTDAATRDSVWRHKYSMSYTCFLYLVEQLRPFIQSESQLYVRAPLEIERAAAMVLYRFAHGLSAREVAEKYNVGASTVRKYTLIVASALAEANKLYGRFVAIPTGDRMARIISQFQQITNVSHMCGAIDGTNIRLYSNTSPTYETTKKSHSILLQAVCDANKLFWDVCCVAPAGAHEAAHFIASNLYQNIKEGLSLQEPVLTLDNKEVTPYMVGDSAYPIRTFLIKPFETDDPLRRAFDKQLRKGSACIDGAFGILKTRWKILKHMNVHLMHAPRIAIACCVLHNICQLWGEPEPPQQEMRTHPAEQTHGSAAAYEIDEAAKIAGETAREALFRDWVKRSLENPHVSLDQENTFSGQN